MLQKVHTRKLDSRTQRRAFIRGSLTALAASPLLAAPQRVAAQQNDQGQNDQGQHAHGQHERIPPLQWTFAPVPVQGAARSAMDARQPAVFLDLSSFAVPCSLTQYALTNGITGTAQDCVPGTRHFGNLGRTSLRGLSYKNWDFALYKNTNFTENLSLQLRAEFFNIVNHPNFASPLLPAFIADAAPNGFAQSGESEVSAGFYSINATGDVGLGNPFLGGGGPRGIQLAAKFTF